jgi:HYR domain-containing protein
MKKLLGLLLFFLLPLPWYSSPSAFARDLTFDERVAAQEAIERVYYSHQIGTTKPFEEAVPRQLLEDQVRAYLKQSAALETFWNTPITAELLQQELERILRETQYPDRLGEVFTALNNDPFLIQECFIRSVLADGLTHHLFARDDRIHLVARREAVALRESVTSGRLSVSLAHPRRAITLFPPESDQTPRSLELLPREDPKKTEKGNRRESLGRRIGPVLEEDDAISFQVLLGVVGRQNRIAVYSVPKEPFELWWKSNQASFDESVAQPVASSSVSLARPSSDSSSVESSGTAETWAPISDLNAPTARYGHAAIWTGSYMIVWGGYNNFKIPQVMNTGGRYDPITNTWTATSFVNAPPGYASSSLVWTGQSMVAFVLDPSLAGGRYDPISNSWSPMASQNLLARRSGQTVTWTGSKMIVWGGLDNSRVPAVVFGDGAIYDPSGNTWSSLSMIDAPDPRFGHLAAWAGNRMVVYGGGTVFLFTPRGGRYDPETDSWSSVTTFNAPGPMGRAVSTGDRMIVWGGLGPNSNYLSHGGHYDPVLDVWSFTSATGAPEGRAYHSLVWTGQQMIVWGGETGSINTRFLQNGGVYDPVGDVWAPTSLVGAPAKRSTHSAVWTGKEMIVWGGMDGSISTPPPNFSWAIYGNGARYVPLPINHLPVADAGQDARFECTSRAGAEVHLDGSRSTDLDSSPGTNDGIVSFVWIEGVGSPLEKFLGLGQDVAVSLSLGVHFITLRVTDSAGAVATDLKIVQVIDTTPPFFACPEPAAVECTSPAGASVALLPPRGVDVCDDAPVVTLSRDGGAGASGVYPLGRTDVLVSAMDVSGNMSSCTFPVTVQDTTPPAITLSSEPAVLWPPNHRMVDVGAALLVTDACSQPRFLLSSIASSDTDDAAGSADGNTANDIQGADVGTADTSFQLRAERSGSGEGRVYRMTYSASDDSGNASSASSFVLVPHDLGGTTEPLVIAVQEMAGGTVLRWDPVSTAQTYRIVRGNVRSLRETADFIDLGTVACVQADSPSTSTLVSPDAHVPNVGEAFYYVAAYNDGRDSGYGTDTATKPRLKTGGGCE